MDGLPGISTNLLTERLKKLEHQQIIARRTLPPPAGSTVYELTPIGKGLESTVIELGRWGSQFLPPTMEDVALPSLGAASVALKAFFHPEQAQSVNEIYELHLSDEVLQVSVEDGDLRVQQGQLLQADVLFHTEMTLFMGLFSGQIAPEAAVAGGLIRIEGGDVDSLKRFLMLTSVPPPQIPDM
jgi:putative sterol carrier protein